MSSTIVQKIDTLLSAKEAAGMLACAPDYIGKLCRDGKLNCSRADNQWLVSKSSLVAFDQARALSKEVRARLLAEERKAENKQHRRADRSSLRSVLLAVGASVGVAVLCLGSSMVGASLSGSSMSAALARIDSPFFAAGEAPVQTNTNAWSGLFAGELQLQLTVRKPSPVSATTTLTDVAVAPVETVATSAPQIVINPVVERTIERVRVENGISTALLTSIVNELAKGSDGAIQYNKSGSLSASSQLSWDSATSQLTVDGTLRTDSLCLEEVCLTKEQLSSLLSRP